MAIPREKKIKHTVGTRIATETYMNTATGQMMTVPVIIKQVEKDIGWHKVWLLDLAHALGLLNNARVDVLAWILENVRADNTVIMTQAGVAKATGISRDTVNFVIRTLRQGDVIKMIHHGAYFVNPDIVAKGSTKRRGELLLKYEEVSTTDGERMRTHAEKQKAEAEAQRPGKAA